VEATDRPLNPYLTSTPIPGVNPPTAMGNTEERVNFQLPVVRDPSDMIGHQQNWPNNNASPAVSCYDDVGTSYQWQSKWWDQVDMTSSLSFEKKFELGARRFKTADSFQPSRMVWLYDEWADIVMNLRATDLPVRNGYGDFNKSVMGFMDGHAAYLTAIQGGEEMAGSVPWDQIPAYSNQFYTVIFTDLRN
jgi:hypothetical protein